MTATNLIRLLLVDDHGLFREGLQRLLESEADFQLLGSVASVAEALALLQRHAADVVLLDYDLGEQTGIHLLEACRDMQLQHRTLMVTAGLSDFGTLRAIRLGAAGIFLKHSPPSDLVTAIRTVHRGDLWLTAASLQALVTAQPQETTASALSPREKAVLQGVFEGLTNKELGVRLDISESYVKAVLQQLFNKTGVRSRSQLVRIALEKQQLYGLDLPV
ncbi:MAG: response regulator transcription factor [Acidobacteriota bacterium]|nr:response regulator transcription factor [Acidobacteriota bacterium]